MRLRRLLYLTALQMTAYRQQGGTLSEEAAFAHSDDGLTQFASYLAGQRRSVFSLLANVGDEAFHVETIPFLRGGDRTAIIARKLGQLFFNARLSTAVSLGYEKSRRKDERVLLAALTNQGFFAPWLAAIAAAEVALAGLYSLPLLAPLLLKKLGIVDEHCLLLTIQDQSIRQTYLAQGKLQFSRLTPLHQSSIVGMAQAFSAEALKLQQYLVSQRVLGRKAPITAYLLAHASARPAIENACLGSETLSFAMLDIEESTRQCALKTLPQDTHSELLFLGLLGRDPPSSQFADDEQRHDYHLAFIRSLLQGVGAVGLSACLLLSARQLMEAYRLNAEADGWRAETTLARQRYDAIVKTFPPIPTSNESLRALIDRYSELERISTSPDSLYREISKALDSVAAVELEGIEWKGVPVESLRSPPSAAGAGRSRSGAEKETAIVRGTLRSGSESNPRQVLAVLDRFLDALKRNPALEVEVLQQPFDIESGKSLKGGDAEVHESRPRSFTVQIRKAVGA